MDSISWDEFKAVGLRAGTVIKVEDFPEARKPAWIITVDFGSRIGIKKTSAQITDLYSPKELLGRQIIAVVNFPPRQIGPFMSEFLLTGFYRKDGAVVMAVPEREVPDGAELS